MCESCHEGGAEDVSVVVRGMRMPIRCLDCPMYDDFNFLCKLYSFGIPARYNYVGATRPEWCPLVDLGKHGDLIDRDALEQEMLDGIKAGNLEEGYEMYANINTVDDCVECVRGADAVIEAEDNE